MCKQVQIDFKTKFTHFRVRSCTFCSFVSISLPSFSFYLLIGRKTAAFGSLYRDEKNAKIAHVLQRIIYVAGSNVAQYDRQLYYKKEEVLDISDDEVSFLEHNPSRKFFASLPINIYNSNSEFV